MELTTSLIVQFLKNLLQCTRPGFNSWIRKIPWRRKRQPTPVFLPGKCYGQRSLTAYCTWGRKELDMTERLSCTELDGLGFSGGSVVKNPLANARDLGWVDPLEKETATHFSILAWEIPWTEEPGRLQSREL